MFENAKWIWAESERKNNEYAEFCQKITYNGGKVNIKYSVSGEYTLFVNGEYVKSVQYADFEYYKVYEDVDITSYLRKGENHVCFLCVYWEVTSQRHFTPDRGLIYEIYNDDGLVAVSDEKTPSRLSRAYESGFAVKISPQMGFSFSYDANKEDEWLKGAGDGFGKSVIIEKNCNFVSRPIEDQLVESRVDGKISGEKTNFVFDLSEETVGFCSFSINSKKEQLIKVFYGELLVDGHVKKEIGGRHFRFEYVAKKGENVFTNYMLRLAGRYIEIECEDEIDVEYMGLLPQVYPTKPVKYDFLLDGLDKDIYKICLHTLKCSMLEHYVDCPWREQCLYAFDSRNQMLTGYYAYEDGNFAYARENLLLMSKDDRADGLMSICFPSAIDLTIPSFCFYYILAVKEYVEHSGDVTLAEAVFDKIVNTVNTFMDNRKDGLVCRFAGKAHWNFYDWSDYADGARYETDGVRTIAEEEVGSPDCLINAIAVIALCAFDKICNSIGKKNPFEGVVEEIRVKAFKKFFNSEKGVFFVAYPQEDATELVNSLSILAGFADENIAKDICKKLASGSFVECSLSMKTFKFDALLKIDENYKDAIVAEIRDTYKIMLDEGATTVWETQKGAGAFDYAGSLCHGWSAIPIYYYHKLMA